MNTAIEITKPRMRRTEASTYLAEKHGVTMSAKTLAKLACIGGGPAFRLDGRFPLYDASELDRWAIERLGDPISSTSERPRP